MKDPVQDELLRLSLRRELSPDEALRVQAFLAAHPALREEWEENAAVGNVLGHLPDVPVSSNFTSRILDSIDQAEQRDERLARSPNWISWRRWFSPRVSWAAMLVIAAALAGYQYRDVQRKRMANDVRLVSEGLARLPDPKILQDFDAINSLRQVSAVSDDELLVALQTQ